MWYRKDPEDSWQPVDIDGRLPDGTRVVNINEYGERELLEGEFVDVIEET